MKQEQKKSDKKSSGEEGTSTGVEPRKVKDVPIKGSESGDAKPNEKAKEKSKDRNDNRENALEVEYKKRDETLQAKEAKGKDLEELQQKYDKKSEHRGVFPVLSGVEKEEDVEKAIEKGGQEVSAYREEEDYLERYRKEVYERMSLTVDILIFSLDREFRLQVLLKKREDFPYKARRSLPGGFVGIEESVEEAAVRVMKQKTGLCDLHLEQLYTFGDKDRDPRMRIVTVAYLAILPRDLSVEGEEDSDFFRVMFSEKGLEFLGSEVFDQDHLAFDHARIIALAVERMRGKLHYTDIALEFLKDRKRFTLFELQKVYEAIEDRDYDTPNFRRYFKNRYEAVGAVEKTGEMSTEFSKRPSSYYRMKKD